MSHEEITLELSAEASPPASPPLAPRWPHWERFALALLSLAFFSAWLVGQPVDAPLLKEEALPAPLSLEKSQLHHKQKYSTLSQAALTSPRSATSPCKLELAAKRIYFDAEVSFPQCARAFSGAHHCPLVALEYGEALYHFAYALAADDKGRARSFLGSAAKVLSSCQQRSARPLQARIRQLRARL